MDGSYSLDYIDSFFKNISAFIPDLLPIKQLTISGYQIAVDGFLIFEFVWTAESGLLTALKRSFRNGRYVNI